TLFRSSGAVAGDGPAGPVRTRSDDADGSAYVGYGGRGGGGCRGRGDGDGGRADRGRGPGTVGAQLKAGPSSRGLFASSPARALLGREPRLEHIERKPVRSDVVDVAFEGDRHLIGRVDGESRPKAGLVPAAVVPDEVATPDRPEVEPRGVVAGAIGGPRAFLAREEARPTE